MRAAFLCRHSLFSRPVARQVFSAIASLTSVFGMGTGGPSRQSTPTAKKKPDQPQVSLCWHYLFSRSVTRQVSSAHVSLTSVFGMGTGGPSHQSAPTIQDYTLKTEHHGTLQIWESTLQSLLTTNCRSSPRLISISQLHTLRRFHL